MKDPKPRETPITMIFGLIALAIGVGVAIWGNNFGYQWILPQQTASASISDAGLWLSKDYVSSCKEDSNTLILCIVGHCFDVSKGRDGGRNDFYGTGGGYHFFAGRDASRAYATGDFKNDLTDNISGMNSDELKGIVTWLEFFRKQEHYRFVGYLEGSALIADPTADPTGSGNGSKSRLYTPLGMTLFRNENENENEETKIKVDETCHSSADIANSIGQVWCKPEEVQVIVSEHASSTSSAQNHEHEQEKSIVYVPRKMHYSGQQGLEYRCICVEYQTSKDRQDLWVYEDCDENASFCSYSL